MKYSGKFSEISDAVSTRLIFSQDEINRRYFAELHLYERESEGSHGNSQIILTKSAIDFPETKSMGSRSENVAGQRAATW